MDFQNIILAFVIIFLLIIAYFIYITVPYQDLVERPKNYGFGNEQIYEIDMNLSLVKKIEVFCLNNNLFKNGVIVSLSGGVDSMVVLAILIKLSLKYKFPVYACSINYNLRPEQKNEMHFLKIYCSIYDVKCYFKEVHGYSRKKYDSGPEENKFSSSWMNFFETKNTSGPRSEFEEESRKIRYDLYQEIINEHKCSGVFVGHHKDDIIENIFTNSMKGANLLDLEVMKEISNIRGINIYRPLLNFHKDVIYDLAHTYSIPYFLDTTPKWSRRGRMRNEIFVLFDNVFTKSWRNKLKDLGDQSNKWGEYINNYVINPIYQETVFGKYGFIMPFKNQPTLIYKTLIMKSMHKLGKHMLKNTSVDKIFENKDSINKVIDLDSGFKMYIHPDKTSHFLIFNLIDIQEKIFSIEHNYDLDTTLNNFLNGNINFDKKDLKPELIKFFKPLNQTSSQIINHIL